MRPRLLALLALSLVSACATPPATTALSLRPAPSPPPATVQCPSSALTAQAAEPLPPAGIDPGALYRALTTSLGDSLGDSTYQFFSLQYPAWARDQAHDAQSFRAWCAEHDGKPPS